MGNSVVAIYPGTFDPVTLGHGVTVEPFEGLPRDIVVARGAKVVVRGLRAATDLDHEFQLASMNRQRMPRVETVFFTSDHGYQSLSSTSVRGIATLGGDVNQFVSPNEAVCLLPLLAVA